MPSNHSEACYVQYESGQTNSLEIDAQRYQLSKQDVRINSQIFRYGLGNKWRTLKIREVIYEVFVFISISK